MKEQDQKDKRVFEVEGFNEIKKEIENLPSGKAFLQIFSEYADDKRLVVINGWSVSRDDKLFLAGLKENLPYFCLGINVDREDLNLMVFNTDLGTTEQRAKSNADINTLVNFSNCRHSDSAHSDYVRVDLRRFYLPNKKNEWVLGFCKRASQIISSVNLKK